MLIHISFHVISKVTGRDVASHDLWICFDMIPPRCGASKCDAFSRPKNLGQNHDLVVCPLKVCVQGKSIGQRFALNFCHISKGRLIRVAVLVGRPD